MHKLVAPSVDVVIPVFNAPELTKRCIASVVANLAPSIHAIYVQDDASDAETAAMLDRLSCSQIHVHHATKNQGYGKSVNEAVARSSADFVLVLNSDTEIQQNFLPILCGALAADPELAVISPVHEDFRVHWERYLRQLGGYIITYRFQGYAFLIRRNVFAMLGGFDAEFGRGYFEDTDLGRRLDRQGWRIGVHPDAHIHHAGGASFGRGRSYRTLVARNRALYLTRYPEVRQNILLISGRYAFAELPVELTDSVQRVLRRGGGIHWLTPVPLPQLSCLQMRNSPVTLKKMMKLMLRGWLREDKRISAVWILPGVPTVLRIALWFVVRMRQLEIRAWKMESI